MKKVSLIFHPTSQLRLPLLALFSVKENHPHNTLVVRIFIVTTDVFGCTVALDSRFQHRDDIYRPDAPGGMGSQTLSGIFID